MSSVGIANLHTSAKLDLRFFTGIDFHPPKGDLRMGADRFEEPVDRPVLAIESVVGNQVLMNPLGPQGKLAFARDWLAKWHALIASRNRVTGLWGADLSSLDRAGVSWLEAGGAVVLFYSEAYECCLTAPRETPSVWAIRRSE